MEEKLVRKQNTKNVLFRERFIFKNTEEFFKKEGFFNDKTNETGVLFA